MSSCCNFSVFEEEVDGLVTPVDAAPFKRESQCVLNYVVADWATFSNLLVCGSVNMLR